MTTERKDAQVFYQPLSVANIQTTSIVGSATVKFGPFSMTSGFTPLYSASPNAASANEVKQILFTLIQDLYGPR